MFVSKVAVVKVELLVAYTLQIISCVFISNPSAQAIEIKERNFAGSRRLRWF